jgi:ABC-type branched-subunit amino acid transport system ATPase component
MGSISWFTPLKKRPDKDDSGILKTSTELYYNRPSAGKEKSYSIFRKQETRILELRHVTRTFGGIRAVDNLDLALNEGEILSIIGPNGAGKTTIFNLISGIYRPTSGEILLEGRSITGLKPHRITELGLTRTFQSLRLFGSMSVLENVKVARFCRTKSGMASILFHLPRYTREEAQTRERALEILSLFGKRLTGYRLNQEASFLSYANRRRLEIARAMCTEAKVLLLDEPSAGMNPQETQEITDFIKTLRDCYSRTIVVIEHKLNVVRTLSDRVIALDYGKKIAEGTYDEVAGNPSVIQAYLGCKENRPSSF